MHTFSSDSTMTQARKPARRGPGRPAQSENRDTRGDILKAAEKLFAITGYEATSLRQIAGEASVDLATVKYHFPEKAALYDETYRLGHARFVERFSPLMVAIAAASTRDSLNEALRTIATSCAKFITEERSFVRLMLYRVLEGAHDPLSVATQLQTDLVELLSSGVDRAASLNLARRIDVPALVTFIVVGVPMWVISAEVRPQLLGIEDTSTPEWSARVEQFIGDMLTRTILAEAV